MWLEIYSGLKTANYVVPDVSVTTGHLVDKGFRPSYNMPGIL